MAKTDPSHDDVALTPADELSMAADTLVGMPAIAAHVGVNVRVGYYLAETGAIPAFKRGDRLWCMRRSTYSNFIATREAEALARPKPAWLSRPKPEEAPAEAPPRQRVRRERLS
jgi:hypothetical protein